MQRVIGGMMFMFALVSQFGGNAYAALEPTLKGDPGVSDAEFRGKLRLMLGKVESSIHALREQIAESQSAPFLSDLYLQLAELLSQKSNTLYYIAMEKTDGEKAERDSQVMSPVVATQKEAIGVYEKILKEFPATEKKAQIQYRIALGYKSIDEIPSFMKMAGGVIHDYPGSEEALRSELLLGQYFFERQENGAAASHFAHVADTSYVYERNLARYRLGLISLAAEKYQPALERFEQVIMDPELKEQDNPYSVSLKSKTLKSDLKREALVDSVRAYTRLHGKGGDPVGYYSRIAPSELHFQEVIEKLAVRYIYMKNFEEAVKLLRSLSERTADPQRVVNIYREVLLMIPIQERAHIPVSEMRYVLGQYHRWSADFELKPEVRSDADQFFEKQIRELATRNHSFAKEQKGSDAAKEYLAKARDYYLLYLGSFELSTESAKMAANLADVYFAQKDWVRSGEYYLRTYTGEFGKPESGQQGQLIENALLCLQKDAGDSFYDTVRRRGLLIRALDSYIVSNEARRRDPSLAFIRAKTRYEQGLFPQSLNELLVVAKNFPASKQAVQSGELILDYFNVRNDYEGLSLWSGRLLSLKLADSAFNQKLASIQSQAGTKLVNEQVRRVPGYDEFAQGQSYLKAALASSDDGLAQVALREALGKSREERDFQTYFKTATLMGEREHDPNKRVAILESVAQENRQVGRYYESLDALKQLYADPKLPAARRKEAFEQAVQTTVLMRDWRQVAGLSQDPLWGQLGSGTVGQVKQAWSELLESPVEIPDAVATRLVSLDQSDDGWLALYKARAKFSVPLRAQVEASVVRKCAGGRSGDSALCRWQELATLDTEKPLFEQQLAVSPLTLEAVQKAAPGFTVILQKYQALGGSGDAQLEIALQLRSEELYQSFSGYLHRVADSNADFREVLMNKAAESDRAALAAVKQCRQLSSTGISPNAEKIRNGVF